jgi:hypothetical protein
MNTKLFWRWLNNGLTRAACSCRQENVLNAIRKKLHNESDKRKQTRQRYVCMMRVRSCVCVHFPVDTATHPLSYQLVRCSREERATIYCSREERATIVEACEKRATTYRSQFPHAWEHQAQRHEYAFQIGLVLRIQELLEPRRQAVYRVLELLHLAAQRGDFLAGSFGNMHVASLARCGKERATLLQA